MAFQHQDDLLPHEEVTSSYHNQSRDNDDYLKSEVDGIEDGTKIKDGSILPKHLAQNFFNLKTGIEVAVPGYFFNDKQIYAKLINFGTLPNNATKNVEHGISDFGQLIRIYGSTTGSTPQRNFPWSPAGSTYMVVQADLTNVSVSSNSNESGYSVFLVMEYTKTS